MKSIRTAAVLAFAFAYAASAGEAMAGDGWRIVESTGAVKVGGASFMPVAVSENQVLPSDSWVETAATGHVILIRGQESIALGPNSRVMLPDEEVNGNTQVLQTLGAALYQIGKQKAPHFQVDTPYLAAVVKGTTFTITVDEKATAVEVTEGLVEVATPDRADVELVQPGFTGIVTKGALGSVVVAPTERPTLPPAVAPKPGTDKSVSSSSPHRVVIAAPIGDTNVDIMAATNGLVQEAVESPTSSSEKGTSTQKAVDVVPGELGDTKAPKLGVALDVALATPAHGVGVGVGLGVENGNGNGVGAGVGLGVENGNGVGAGVGLGVGNENGNGGGGGNGVGGDGGLGLGVGVGAGGGGVGGGLGVGVGGVGVGAGLGIGGGNGPQGGLLGGLNP